MNFSLKQGNYDITDDVTETTELDSFVVGEKDLENRVHLEISHKKRPLAAI